jgi:hypothetical protein
MNLYLEILFKKINPNLVECDERYINCIKNKYMYKSLFIIIIKDIINLLFISLLLI